MPANTGVRIFGPYGTVGDPSEVRRGFGDGILRVARHPLALRTQRSHTVVVTQETVQRLRGIREANSDRGILMSSIRRLYASGVHRSVRSPSATFCCSPAGSQLAPRFIRCAKPASHPPEPPSLPASVTQPSPPAAPRALTCVDYQILRILHKFRAEVVR